MADINVDDITNSGGTGVFDKLMESINSQIETQYLSNRITGSDYATVYLGSLQAALTQSIQFTMQEELTEAQIEGVIADNALKAKQQLLVDAQIKAAYADRVLKDKQAAKLGLDTVMKRSEDAKKTALDSDNSFVYTPNYEE